MLGSILSVELILILLSLLTSARREDLRASGPSPIGRVNRSALEGDYLAEEQRVALQIITTDLAKFESLDGQKSGGNLIAKSSGDHSAEGFIENAGSELAAFRDQYDEMMSGKLSSYEGTSKMPGRIPKRIVINLNTNASESGQSGETRLTIGFSHPSIQKSAGERVVGNRDIQQVIRESTTLRPAPSSSQKDMKEIGAILRGVRQMGGVPAVIVNESSRRKREKLPIKLMLNSEAIDKLNRDDRILRGLKGNRLEGNKRIQATSASSNRHSAREDGESNEEYDKSLSRAADHQGGTNSDLNSILLEENMMRVHATQLAENNKRNQRREVSHRQLDKKESKNDRNYEQASPKAPTRAKIDIESREQTLNRLDGSGDALSLEVSSARAIGDESLGASGKDSQPSSARRAPNDQEEAEKELTTIINSKQIDMSLAPDFNLNSNQSHRPKDNSNGATLNNQRRKSARQEPANSAISPHQEHEMAERVARLMDRLKLYTTKEQLMKVAKELEAHEPIESRLGEAKNGESNLPEPDIQQLLQRTSDFSEQSNLQQQMPSIKSTDKHLLHLESPKSLRNVDQAHDGQQIFYQGEPAGSNSANNWQLALARSRLPAPVRYELGDSLEALASQSVATDEQSAILGQVHRPSSELDGNRVLHTHESNASELGRKFIAHDIDKLSKTENPSELEEENQAIPEELLMEQDNSASMDEDPSNRDYTSNSDLVKVFEKNERLYNDDESINDLDDGKEDQKQYSSRRKNAAAEAEDEIRAMEQIIDELVEREKHDHAAKQTRVQNTNQ